MNIYDKLAGEFRVSHCDAKSAVYQIAWGLPAARLLREDFKRRAWELLWCDRESHERLMATMSKKHAACELPEASCYVASPSSRDPWAPLTGPNGKPVSRDPWVTPEAA